MPKYYLTEPTWIVHPCYTSITMYHLTLKSFQGEGCIRKLLQHRHLLIPFAKVKKIDRIRWISRSTQYLLGLSSPLNFTLDQCKFVIMRKWHLCVIMEQVQQTGKNINVSDTHTLVESLKSKKSVRFNTTIIVREEPPHLSHALREARKSNLFEWRADCARVKAVLDPILSISHRASVLQQRQLRLRQSLLSLDWRWKWAT